MKQLIRRLALLFVGLPIGLSVGLLSGCYNPKIPNGTQECAANNVCASGYTCAVDNHCYLNGQLPVMPPDLAMALDLSVANDLAMCTPSSCSGPTPICDSSSGLCVVCVMDSQCADGQLCTNKICVPGCSQSHGCGDAGACDVDAAICKTCRMDSDCGDPQNPRCDTNSGRCVACLSTNDNCGNDLVCVQVNGVWGCQMGCKVDNDCVSPSDGGVGDGGAPMKHLSCCNRVCVDETSDNGNCGKCGVACMNGNTCCASACADTTSDVANCGTCGATCTGMNASWSCANSQCAVLSCNGTFRDCNMKASDGCEANIISDPNNCLGCGKVCAVPNAMAGCNQGCNIGTCNMGFADCDGNVLNGCEANVATNVNNCGACKKVCGAISNGTPGCAMGMCSVMSCNPNFADCNMVAADGCEANLSTDPNNCKACGTKCPMAPNSTSACVMGVCGVGMCNPGFKDCNNNPNDGCEVNTTSDPSNCGACSMKCGAVANASPGCNASVCGVGTCTVGFADCDKLPNNGCEVNTNTDPNNCKTCNTKCAAIANGTATCAAGLCGGVCSAGFADCNNNLGDGCEINLNTDSKNCGMCGKACANGVSCAAGMCQAGVMAFGVFRPALHCASFANHGGNYQQYCFQLNNVFLCIGQNSGGAITCADINGGGVHFTFDLGNTWPMRFTNDTQTCENYNPPFLTNLANAIGYAGFTLNTTKTGNGCNLTWIDVNGNFASGAGNGGLAEIYDITFQ